MMKLKDAPIIVKRFFDDFHGHNNELIIKRAAARVREQYSNAANEDGENNELKKIAEDIWALDKPIGLHTDKTANGHRVFGVVLINDPNLQLFYENVSYDLPVGTIYHIDGHRRHGALAHNRVEFGKLFAFLAWDVPSYTQVDELIADVIPSLQAYVNGHPRVNILAT